ncbi:MAG: ATP-binding protein [Desulfocurvibacter africanus]
MSQIVVLSGKGGTGKTSIVLGLATVMPSKVLADCDVDAADLHLIAKPQAIFTQDFVSGELARIEADECTQCLLCQSRCRFEAITMEPRILAEHCEGCGLCAFICPVGAIKMDPRHCGWLYESRTRFGTMVHAMLKPGAENSGRLVTTVRRRANELAVQEGCAHVLVDGSPGIGCPVIASLTGADLALLVAEPTVSALHDLRRVHELARHFRIPCLVLVNKADLSSDRLQEIRDFCSESGLRLVGEIPYDPVFTKAQLAGQSVVEFDPRSQKPRFEAIWDLMRETLEKTTLVHL